MNAKKAKLFRRVLKDYPHISGKNGKWLMKKADAVGIGSAFAFAQFCDIVVGAPKQEEKIDVD